LAISSCANFPKVHNCVIEIKSFRLACQVPGEKQITYVPLDQADGYIAMSPDDFGKVIDWGKQNCQSKSN